MEINSLKKRKEVQNMMRRIDPRSESEPEIMLYEKFCQGGARPIKQFEIAGYFVDMAFPDKKVAIEYDGAVHKERLVEDEARHKIIRNMGWSIARVRNEKVGMGGFFSIYLNEKKPDCFFANFEDAIDELVKLVLPKVKDYGERPKAEFSDIKDLLRTAYEKVEANYSKNNERRGG